MTILISAGPIPALLDSVKVITNKFKGGLALKTAKELSKDFDVHLIKWGGADMDIPSNMTVTNISDVNAYYKAVLSIKADTYILAAAVANLMPTHPFEGKFPSHNYNVGDTFDITFTISPRVIDEIKNKYPNKTLIGYKLFDGSETELIAAGFKTLRESRSNVIFCNHPATAKSEKIALTADGATIKMSFEEHVRFIKRVASLKWYRTEVKDLHIDEATLDEASNLFKILKERVFIKKGDLSFGTFAVRHPRDGFITTTRGKRGAGLCRVYDVRDDVVIATQKATLNAPLLFQMFRANPEAQYIIHGHKRIEGKTFRYSFPGTIEDNYISAMGNRFNIEHHGYYAIMYSDEELYEWLEHERA